MIDSIENIHEFCVDNAALTEGSVVYPRWGMDISIVFGGEGSSQRQDWNKKQNYGLLSSGLQSYSQ